MYLCSNLSNEVNYSRIAINLSIDSDGLCHCDEKSMNFGFTLDNYYYRDGYFREAKRVVRLDSPQSVWKNHSQKLDHDTLYQTCLFSFAMPLGSSTFLPIWTWFVFEPSLQHLRQVQVQISHF